MVFKIKTLNKIAKSGLDRFSNLYEITDGPVIDGILVRSYKMHDLELPESLKAIARAGAGVNNVPVEKCAEKGIVVFNTPGANANGVKELVIAALLLSSRDVAAGIGWAQSLKGQGDEVPKLIESGKSSFAGPEIKGKTLGVIGLGAIGVLVANAASALGMEVLGYDPFISVDSAWGLSRAVHRATSLDEIYAKADYITLHVPLLDATKGMIGESSIKAMKDGVRILNFARGGLVDDAAMRDGLASGKVARYVTDFPNAATLNMPNALCIPHLGASTPESEENCALMAVEQMMNYLENGNIVNSVNYPDCDMGRPAAVARIAVNHKNVPNMVGQITSALAAHNVNISDMVNKSRKQWAYTLLDVENEVTDEILQAIASIDGVLKTRVI